MRSKSDRTQLENSGAKAFTTKPGLFSLSLSDAFCFSSLDSAAVDTRSPGSATGQGWTGQAGERAGAAPTVWKAVKGAGGQIQGDGR